MSLRDKAARLVPLFEAELDRVVRSADRGHELYYGMMRYHLGWADETLRPASEASGKRLRPLLCLLSCEAVGGDPSPALPAACALELIHNFSLVHDDIQDGSHLRRGRRTVWDIWGVAHAINAGDGLFVLARLALHGLAARQVPTHRYLAACQTFDRACLALCEGQFLDMHFATHSHISVDDYLTMIRGKTAALLAAAAEMGGILASDDPGVRQALYRFGENLGLAFQIQDDILGVWGDSRVTGKSAATDLRDRKKTLPVVHALSQSRDPTAARCLASLYERREPLDDADIGAAVELLDRAGARGFTEEMAQQYHDLALASLSPNGFGERNWDDLRELAESLLGRQA